MRFPSDRVGVISIRIGARAPKRRRPTKRELGVAIAMAQRAEACRLHADRDRCLPCLLTSMMLTARAMDVIPAKLATDDWWWHRRVDMPAARRMARLDDEHGRGEGPRD